MPNVNYEIVLVPDIFGIRPCVACSGYGWSYGYRDSDCEVCNGNGHFREETQIIPTKYGITLQSPHLSQDSYGRYIHPKCNGGGVRFFQHCGVHHWSCTSCKQSGELSLPDWKIAQTTLPPLNLLANARGAENLLKLCRA